MTWLQNFIDKDLLNPSTIEGAIFYAVLFVIVSVAAARFLRAALLQPLKRELKHPVDRTALTFLAQLVQIAVYLVAGVFYAHLVPALRSFGTVLLAGVSIASIVLGLAAQNTLSNLIAGISLVLYRPVQIDDRVQFNAPTGLEMGKIESINLGYSVIRTFDQRRVIIPNSVMAGSVIVNLTKGDPRTLASIPVTIGQAQDIDRAREILIELAQAHPLVQQVDNCPVTRLDNYSLTLTLRVWCAHAGDAKWVEFDLYEQIAKRFAEEKIQGVSPYPVRMLEPIEDI
jgi:small conductance mechanosensitive channel